MPAFERFLVEFAAKNKRGDLSTSGQNPAIEHETVMELTLRLFDIHSGAADWQESR